MRVKYYFFKGGEGYFLNPYNLYVKDPLVYTISFLLKQILEHHSNEYGLNLEGDIHDSKYSLLLKFANFFFLNRKA